MTDPTAVADRYIAAWNETDADRRRALIAESWAPDATYVDPIARAEGHAALDALIAAVQARFPGFRFALLGRPDGHGDRIRFRWSLGPEGAGEAPVEGTDFAVLEAGRLKAVTGFLDRVPPGA